MRFFVPTLSLLTSAVLSAAESPTSTTEGLFAALAGGTPTLFLRARHEHVDQDNPAFTGTAVANTLRVALGYQTAAWYDLTGGVQFEGVYDLGGDVYHSGFNGNTDRPTIGDTGDVEELQQAWLRYTPAAVAGTMVTAGRQELNVENQRYIGAVAWRQDWQTFDAVSAAWKPSEGATKGCEAFYAYLDDVHRITPENTLNGGIDLGMGHAAVLAYSPGPVIRVAGYAYLIDFAPKAGQAPNDTASTDTYGLRATGSLALNEPWKLVYTGEFAQQSAGDDNPIDVDASYWLLEGGAQYAKITTKLGYEVLGGDASEPGNRFTTPLATLHAFQGWADMFLTTPNAGVTTLYLSAMGVLPGRLSDCKVGMVILDFAADDGSDHFGSEIDLLLEYTVRPLDPRLLVGVKFADYTADEGDGALIAGTTQRNVDTQKYWLYSQFSF